MHTTSANNHRFRLQFRQYCADCCWWSSDRSQWQARALRSDQHLVFHCFPNPDFQGFCLVFARNKSVIPRKFKRDVFQAFFRLKRPVQQLLSARGAENRGKDEKQERTIYTFPFLFLEIFTCCKVPSSCFSCSSWWRLLSERHGCPRRSCWRAVRFHDGRRLRRSCPRLRRRAPDHGHSDC